MESIFNRSLQFSPSQKVISISHTDADGMMSGNIIRTYFRQVYSIGINYNQPIDYSVIPPSAVVFITDFSLPPEEMRRLCQKNTVVWIDHHPTYMQPEYAEFKNLEGIRCTDWAACKLTWQYFYPSIPAPLAVEYVNDYDTWSFIHEEALPFSYALSLINIAPKSSSDITIRKLLYEPVYLESLVNMGKRIKPYVDKKNIEICKDCAFKTELDGHKAVAINMRQTNSLVLSSVQTKEYPLIITFGYDASSGLFRCGLYNDDNTVNCNELAVKYGGGGHVSASGMSLPFDQLPFKLPAKSAMPPETEDFVSKIEQAYCQDPLLARYETSSRGLLCKKIGYPTEFMGMSAFAINNPFWSDSSLYTTNVVMEYELAIFWNFTNSGWFRYRIYSLEKNHKTLEELTKLIPNSKIVGNAVWFYTDRPIENPHPEKTVQEIVPRVPYEFYKNKR